MDPAYQVYVDLATTNAVILHHQFRTEVMRVSYFHPSPPPSLPRIGVPKTQQ